MRFLQRLFQSISAPHSIRMYVRMCARVCVCVCVCVYTYVCVLITRVIYALRTMWALRINIYKQLL